MGRAALFFAPLLAVLLVHEYALWSAGETWPIQRVSDRARGAGEVLFGRKLLPDEMQRFKAHELVARRPRIVALGSSTAMEYRARAFMGYEAQFYNLGGLVHRVDDLEIAARLLDETGSVKVVILNLDLWWFNPNTRPHTTPLAKVLRSRESAFDWRAHVYSIRLLLEHFRKYGSQTFGQITSDRSPIAGALAIGLAARTGSGFRLSDGSYQYGDYLRRSHTKIEFRDTASAVQRIEQGNRRFEPAHAVSEQRIAYLDQFLSECERAGIAVYGVIGPLSTDARAALARSQRHAGLLADFRTAMSRMFTRHDAPLVDASDPAAVGLDDRYLIDAFHGSETFAATVVRELARDPSFAARLPELAAASLDLLLGDPRTTPAELAPGLTAPSP